MHFRVTLILLRTARPLLAHLTRAALTRAKHAAYEVIDAAGDQLTIATLLAHSGQKASLDFLCLLGSLLRGLLRSLLLHAKDAVVKGLLSGVARLLRLKKNRVGKLAAHLLNFFLLLILLRLLRHLEEMRVENLVRVECVRVRVVLFVVGLINSLQLVITLRNARD